MRVFVYDYTFEGMLTAVFEAYSRRSFPDLLMREGDVLPLFCEETFQVYTDQEKADRVWSALVKKQSTMALTRLTMCWLSELPDVGMLLFRYIRKTIDAPASIELNFADEDVLALTKLWKKVANEQTRILQFLRFQKAQDGTYFAAMEPLYNVLPLAVNHFSNRFRDQRWLIYDLKRSYGYYYDLRDVTEVRFEEKAEHLVTGMLDKSLMAEDEELFQRMWKTYSQSTTIRERLNPKLHRQNMPVRFWKYMTEKQ